MVFEKTIFIDRELLKKYSDMLNTEPADEAECLGEEKRFPIRPILGTEWK